MSDFIALLKFVWKYRHLLWRHRNTMMASIASNEEKAFTGEQISAFAENLEIEKTGIHLSPEYIDSYVEEVMFRKLSCEDCVKAGACPVCECPTPLKMQAPSQFCPIGTWQRMEDDGGKTWNIFKEDMGIEFELKYKS